MRGTSFLPDFPKFLFGSTKKKESEVLAARLGSLRSSGLSELSAVIGRFLHLGELFIVDALTDVGQNIVKRPQNSVVSLRPDNPVLPMILDLPVKQGVSVHSIIAQKQTGRPLLESSDGIVPYTSAHLERVASESVVPGATHSSVLEHPECIDEVLRILYRHAGRTWEARKNPESAD